MCDGSGLETYEDGSFYSGKWKKDEKDGEGILTDKNGVKFVQVWGNGRLISE